MTGIRNIKADELMDGMNAEHAGQRADELFSSSLYCAESVLKAVAEEANIESWIIPRIATGFCSGLARTNGTCGAVNGGIMALGLLLGRDDSEGSLDGIYAKVQEFLKGFENKFGSCNCFKLTGCDLTTEEGRKDYYLKEMPDKCSELTGMAAYMVTGLITDSCPISLSAS